MVLTRNWLRFCLAQSALLACGGGGEGDEPTPSLGHPFGSHAGYAASGIVFPGQHAPAELDAAAAAFYDEWKSRYFVPGCAEGQAYVEAQADNGAWIVSEGVGYGMIFMAIMAGHDPDARTQFDALFRYYRAHPSVIDARLMAWAQDEACAEIPDLGSGAATDGDLDAAYALLLADRQWGSGGTIDYFAEAQGILEGILASEVHPSNTLLFGDWINASDPTYYEGTRTSDFIMGHLKAFEAATGRDRWAAVADRTFSIIAHLQTAYAPATGLLPDFVVAATGYDPHPAAPGYLEGPSDGQYAWNACRTPWRLGTDAVVSGDERSRTAVRRLNAWVRQATGDDPHAITAGYDLDGTALNGDVEVAFTAPFLVGALVEPAQGSNQGWIDSLWDAVAATPPSDYYGDSLKLFALLVASRNWWAP
jgi:endo-1,4-beta-D-glucanase Y